MALLSIVSLISHISMTVMMFERVCCLETYWHTYGYSILLGNNLISWSERIAFRKLNVSYLIQQKRRLLSRNQVALSASCLKNRLTLRIISSTLTHSFPASSRNNSPSKRPWVNTAMIMGSSLVGILLLISLNRLKYDLFDSPSRWRQANITCTCCWNLFSWWSCCKISNTALRSFLCFTVEDLLASIKRICLRYLQSTGSTTLDQLVSSLWPIGSSIHGRLDLLSSHRVSLLVLSTLLGWVSR